MEKGKILVINSDKLVTETLVIFLNELNFKVILAFDGRKGFQLFEKEKPNLIITDVKVPKLDGMTLLKMIKKIDQNVPIILITAFDDMNSIIEAMQIGAYDCIENPLDLGKLKSIVTHAIETYYLSKRLEITSSELLNKDDENIIVGKNFKIKEILKVIGKVSSTRVNVLIEGESGTGKELISRVIHNSGVTKDFPFIPVNLSALPETLLESELFGFEKGSFTGALKNKKGKFELAEQGTIFLDEISDISQNLQVKLLRVIQEREFERIGSETTIPMKARIITATNKNLEELVQQGKFREDLFYRLNVFKISAPPLRERKEDIPNLVIHFLKKINRDLHKNVNKIPYEVIEILQNYEWVGNVRELENILLQAVVLAKGEVLEKENILLRKIKKNNTRKELIDPSLAMMEKEHIKNILDKVNWNKKEAAKLLKVSRQTLYNKIKALSIIPS
ncbi:MAG: sigma-54 dependent transcriptional regulator [Bacteroidetes bacterium]|nr:sigma-54 dependent transcriptional regulator [Bacteroidota bacterium]